MEEQPLALSYIFKIIFYIKDINNPAAKIAVAMIVFAHSFAMTITPPWLVLEPHPLWPLRFNLFQYQVNNFSAID